MRTDDDDDRCRACGRHLTVAEAAVRLAISEPTLRLWIRRGWIPIRQLARYYPIRIPARWVELWDGRGSEIPAVRRAGLDTEDDPG